MSVLSQSDIEFVHRLFSKVTSISSTDFEVLGKYLKKASFKKGDNILEIGQVETSISIVTKGVVHMHTYIDGELFTINISIPGMLYNSLNSYINSSPTLENQVAVSDVEILYLEKSDSEYLMQNNHAFCYVYAKLFEYQLSEREHRTLLLQYKSALKRFELFMSSSTNAKLYLQEVPQKLVAQYLGLAPETFCRAKSQYFKQNN